jgi:hypothetical protein
LNVETTYFLTGSVRVREGPETAPILVRILAYRDHDFDITLTEPGGGEVELTIDGARELDDDRMTRLEEQLQALGPYARETAIFRRHYGLDACDVIVAPSREAGRVALSRVVLEDIRLSLGALVPEDRARLAEELRERGRPDPPRRVTTIRSSGRPAAVVGRLSSFPRR